MGQEFNKVLKEEKELAKLRAKGKEFQAEGQSPKVDMVVCSRSRPGGQNICGRVGEREDSQR